MNIELSLQKEAFAPKFFPYLFDYSHRWEIYKGSAGSGKSYFITQKLICRACREKIKILVCRRFGTTLRNTCFALFKEVLSKWRLTPYIQIRETDFNIKFPNGSEIIFSGLDEETKLLSLAGIGVIWVEECYEVPKPIIEQLNLRLRGRTPNQQIIMSFNPISKTSWLYDFCEVAPPDNLLYTHSTYQDNPFLNKEYIAELDAMKVRNPNKARIYCYGEWGVDSESLVFTNWKEGCATDGGTLTLKVGVDFGWHDATTIAVSLYDEANKTIYVIDEYYATHIQLDRLADELAAKHLNKTPIYCDSAEPRSIEFLRSKGFNAKPCIKGKDSVKSRITFLQNHTIIVDPQCRHMLEELGNFSYIKNKDGNYTEATTHEYSHLIDALGYAYSDIYRNGKLKTLDKAALGL